MLAASTSPKVARPRVTPQCGWCGGAFKQVRVFGAVVWECTTPACADRQWAQALTFPQKDGSVRLGYLPLPRQVDALEAVASRQYRRVLYGGAAGGSKSHFLRWLAYRECLAHPHFHVLLLRRTFKDLERTHMLAAEVDQEVLGASFVASKFRLSFPNGSLIEYGHCQDTQDWKKYLSAEYDLVLIDELVTFEEEMALLLMSRARTTKQAQGVRPLAVAGTNPGGPNARWVVDRWLDHEVDTDRYPDYDPAEYCYIKATLADNPYLDQEYERSLADLPTELRQAYLDGRWDIFPGQYFQEFSAARHVAQLTIPENVLRIGGLDWGYIQPGVFLWIALLADGRLYVEDEYVFSKTVPGRVAETIVQRTKAMGRRVLYTRADPAMWIPSSETGEGMAESFSRAGLPLLPGNHDRLNGWQRVRHWLGLDETEHGPVPRMLISPNCRYLLRTLPTLVSADNRPEDVETTGADHAADALRYAVMSRPMVSGHHPMRPKTADMAGWLFDQARKATIPAPLGGGNVGW